MWCYILLMFVLHLLIIQIDAVNMCTSGSAVSTVSEMSPKSTSVTLNLVRRTGSTGCRCNVKLLNTETVESDKPRITFQAIKFSGCQYALVISYDNKVSIYNCKLNNNNIFYDINPEDEIKLELKDISSDDDTEFIVEITSSVTDLLLGLECFEPSVALTSTTTSSQTVKQTTSIATSTLYTEPRTQLSTVSSTPYPEPITETSTTQLSTASSTPYTEPVTDTTTTQLSTASSTPYTEPVTDTTTTQLSTASSTNDTMNSKDLSTKQASSLLSSLSKPVLSCTTPCSPQSYPSCQYPLLSKQHLDQQYHQQIHDGVCGCDDDNDDGNVTAGIIGGVIGVIIGVMGSIIAFIIIRIVKKRKKNSTSEIYSSPSPQHQQPESIYTDLQLS